MTYRRFFFAVLLALSAAQMQAQNVYRCGSSYSQTPCPGSTPVDVADERSKTQKAQADAASRRDQQAAEAMEKNRLQQEDRQARMAGAKSGAPGAASAPSGDPSQLKSRPHGAKKGRQPEYFTASAGSEKGKKNKGGTTGKTGGEGKPAAP